jgi:hypothetical protein
MIVVAMPDVVANAPLFLAALVVTSIMLTRPHLFSIVLIKNITTFFVTTAPESAFHHPYLSLQH